MKIIFSLLVLTSLMAQLTQLRAAPQRPPSQSKDLKSKLMAILQGLMETQEDDENALIQGGGFSSKNCGYDFTSSGPLATVNQKYGSQFRVEFHCGNPSSKMTSITDYESASYYKWVELQDKGHYVCRGGGSDRIRIGPCKVWNLPLVGRIHIPVGSPQSNSIQADVFLSESGGTLDCIAVENFSGPSC